MSERLKLLRDTRMLTLDIVEEIRYNGYLGRIEKNHFQEKLMRCVRNIALLETMEAVNGNDIVGHAEDHRGA